MRAAGLALMAVMALMTAASAGGAPPPDGATDHGAAQLTLSIVGTNDLHGHLESLPALGGYLRNLRAARAREGGGVVLLDGGDMFQGTLESNLGEGAGVVRAYNALGYTAAAIGNHEFDFGPVGEAATPGAPGDDPRGALKARAAEAAFPLLSANLLDAAAGTPARWPDTPNVRPWIVRDVAGIKVGVVGVTTRSTARTTIAANFAGLAVAPIAPATETAAAEARAAGATVVLLAAHAGGACRELDNPDALESCQADSEIFQAARALARSRRGAVDAIVAGHTHDGIAQRVAGIPIVEAFSNGRAFGRIDLTVDRRTGRAVAARIFPPQPLCRADACAAERYEGAAVIPDAAIAAVIAPEQRRARERRETPLGVTVAAAVTRTYDSESPLGNLFADLMRAAHPEGDVALTNGGGLRAELPAGPLTYGRLFEAIPFDNRFATVPVTGAELRRLIALNLGRTGGIVSLSGVRAQARCGPGGLDVTLQRPDGRAVRGDERLTLVTSDFLATGGDGLLGPALQRAAHLDGGPPIREAMAGLLRARGGTLSGGDPTLFDPEHPRLSYPGARPVRCRGPGR